MRQLILATRNSHKTREFAAILGNLCEVRDLRDYPEIGEIEETGASFEENAVIKAVHVSRQLPGLVVADDSGLEVDLLNGAPGIYSARYAGEHSTDAENIAKLLGELTKPGPLTEPVAARFRCCLALAEEGEVRKTFEGIVEGIIVPVPRGTLGFGYDPVFQPEGFDQTFAELSPAEKNRISHRSRAIESLRREWLG